jgi:excinuclease UvrABC helicase subunit UvrB
MTDVTEPKTNLQLRQETLAQLVQMLARKLSASLFIHGIGGTGKTMTVMKVLQDEGIGALEIGALGITTNRDVEQQSKT